MESVKWQKLMLLFSICFKCSSCALSGECNKCLSNNIACLDETAFTTCLNGKLTDNRTRCPANTVCTAESEICQPRFGEVSAACFDENCGSCERTGLVFACLDEKTYAFCYDQTMPDLSSKKTCPQGTVCNVESLNVCVAEADGGVASCKPDVGVTTGTTATTPKTQATPIDPDKFCANQDKTGNFKAPDDLNCKDYIYCYPLAGQYLGNRYKCEGYFNSASGKCQIQKPIDC